MRKLVLFSCPFALAAAAAHYLLPTAARLPAAVAVILLVAAAAVFLRSDARTRTCIILCGAVFGLLWYTGYSALSSAPVDKLDGTASGMTAVVTGYPGETDYGLRLDVRLRCGSVLPVNAILYADELPDLYPGDVIEFTARYRTSEIRRGEHTDVYTSRGVRILAYLESDCTVVSRGGALSHLPAKAAKAVKDMIRQVFPDDMSAFMTALLTGDKTLYYKDVPLYCAITNSGLSHIVAASGMHLSFLVAFISLIVRKKKFLPFICLPVIIFFMAMVGFTPSVTRAGIMTVMYLTAPLLKRESDSLTSLFAATLLILLVNPYAVASVSLQLSFFCVLGIALFTERISGGIFARLSGKKLFERRLPRALLRVCSAGLAVSLGGTMFSMPLTALYFGRVPLLSPIVNILTLWAVSICFCLAFVACLLGAVWLPAGTAVAFVSSLFARYIICVAGLVSKLSVLSVFTTNPACVAWLALSYALLLIVIIRGSTLKGAVTALCASVCALCVIIMSTAFIASGQQLSMTALDVGQGQSVLFTSGRNAILVDCGGDLGSDAGTHAAQKLLGGGRQKLDVLILTHYDSDHTNGIEYLFEMVQVGAVLAPAPDRDPEAAASIAALAQSHGADMICVDSDISVGFGGSSAVIYAPAGGESGPNSGLFVLVSRDDFDFLVTEDSSSKDEIRLTLSRALPDIEVLVAGHHGSSTSTSQALLDAVTPETAVISVGYNIYGHPSEQVLERLYSCGVAVYRTDELGDIHIRSE